MTTFVSGKFWASRPAGLLIFALPDGVTVESAGHLLMGIRLVREHLAVLDEAVLMLPDADGYREQHLTVAAAKKWASEAKVIAPIPGQVRAPRGVQRLEIGEPLLEAWAEHTRLFNEARAQTTRASLTLVPKES